MTYDHYVSYVFTVCISDDKDNVDRGLRQISAGQAGVWGLVEGRSYCRHGTFANSDSAGANWQQLEGVLSYISSESTMVWAVNSGHDVYYRADLSQSLPCGTDWELIPIIMGMQISDCVNSVNNIVCLIQASRNVYCRTGRSETNAVGNGWQLIPGSLKYISHGEAGMLGIKTSNEIGYRVGTSNYGGFDNTCPR